MGQGDRRDDEPLDDHGEGADDELAATRGVPPHPLDRIWLHPSELPPAPAGSPVRRRAAGWLGALVAGAAGALVAVLVLALTGALDRHDPGSDPSPPTGRDSLMSAAEAAALIGPSIVAVTARDATGLHRGSGVCVRHGAQVLTSIRVVGDASDITIVTADGTRHEARVGGRDLTTDLVLLEVDADLPAAKLAPRPSLPGTPVWILGAPAASSTHPWLSGGMLSSNDAILAHAAGAVTGPLMETTAVTGWAAVGGALVDRNAGSVAGIVLGRIDGGTTTYAISIGEAVAIAEQLTTKGVAEHGTLRLAGVDGPAGPTVTEMAARGPAARAGIRVGDVIVALDDRPVLSIADVLALARAHRPGHEVEVELRRAGRTRMVTVTIGTAP